MRVSIENLKPMWVRYTGYAEIPDNTPLDELNDVMHDLISKGEWEIESGPDPIEHLDQEWTFVAEEKQ